MSATHSVAEPIFDSRVQAHFENNVELYVDHSLECYEEASLSRLAQMAQVTGFRPSAKFRLLGRRLWRRFLPRSVSRRVSQRLGLWSGFFVGNVAREYAVAQKGTVPGGCSASAGRMRRF